MDGLATMVGHELIARADPERARGMAAYMKSEMPCFGVHKPGRQTILRRAVAEFPPADAGSYRENVTALWSGTHREQKYLAIAYARSFADYITVEHADLYRSMIVEGAWWDFVDEMAGHLVGRLVARDRDALRPRLERWIDDENMWLRRTAILCQLRHKADTDQAMLFDFCRRRAEEGEFFIRKAIGWALREYAKTDPDAVRRFLTEMGDELSGLSRREAAKHL